jgi:hypothetical protein
MRNVRFLSPFAPAGGEAKYTEKRKRDLAEEHGSNNCRKANIADPVMRRNQCGYAIAADEE